jgi:hypothetical protein
MSVATLHCATAWRCRDAAPVRACPRRDGDARKTNPKTGLVLLAMVTRW